MSDSDETIPMQSKDLLMYPSTFEVKLVQTEAQLEKIFGIRMTVFVQEQNVPAEEELDSYDNAATHFLISRTEDDLCVGTARLLDKGEGIAKIGRVAIIKEFRGLGLGALLMRFIEREALNGSYKTLILEAQCYAIPFYEKLGYTAEGEVFLDANIEHRLMKKTLDL